MLPVGPEFQDPPEVYNQRPYLVSALPFPSMVQSFSGNKTYGSQVTAHDPDVNDTLTGQWIVNYPDYINAVTTGPPMHATPTTARDPAQNFTFMLSINCMDFPPAPANSLAFIVSDRGFLDPTVADQYDSAHRYNFDNETPPQKILTMIDWPIIGCQ